MPDTRAVMETQTRRKLTLATCSWAHGIQDGLSATLFVLLPILAQTFGLSYAEVGIVRATKTVTATLLELPSGMLAEWFGERRLLVFGLACAGVGYLLLGSADSIGMVLISLLIVGAGSAFQHALSSSVISHVFEDGGRRPALGLYNSSGDAGKLAFTGMFSLAIGVGLAWQGVITGFGLIALASGVAVLFTLRGLSVGHHRPAVDGKPKARLNKWGIRHPTGFMALSVIVFFDTAVQAGFLTFVAFLIATRGVPTNLAAVAVVLTLIGGMFGKAGCGYLAERMGVAPSFVLVQCATAVGIIALLLLPTWLAFALLPVLGIFLQGSTSITYGSVSDFVDGDRSSRAFAVIYSVSSLSAIVGPVVFGLVGDHFGLAMTMSAMAAVSLLAAPLILVLRRHPAAQRVG